MTEIFSGPADWRGPEMINSTQWVHRFSETELAEIDTAVRHAQRLGRNMDTLRAADFPLPTVSAYLDHARDYIEDGAGLYLFRGIPVERYSKDELRFLFWGIGKHMGTAVSQSTRGDVLGDVRNIGEDMRIYTSNLDGPFHGDTSDVVGLFVVRTAKSGGLSQIVSTVAIHNEMARTRPDLLEVLYEPVHWRWHGAEHPGGPSWFLQPIFAACEGKLSCTYIRSVVSQGHELPGAPPLTAKQVEALDYLDALAASPAFHFSMMFETGDIQFLNNHICVHARSAFEDYPEIDRRRHLLRLWLSVPNSRPLSPAKSAFWNPVGGSVRGGFGHDVKPIYQTISDLRD